MFCDKKSNNLINSVHKRALKAVRNRFYYDYDTLLETTKTISIHEIHLKTLICEIFKTKNNLNPGFMKELYLPKVVPYNLRNTNLLRLPNTRTVKFGLNSFAFRGNSLWNKLPDEVKNSSSLIKLKNQLKSIDLKKLCDCKLCT